MTECYGFGGVVRILCAKFNRMRETFLFSGVTSTSFEKRKEFLTFKTKLHRYTYLRRVSRVF